MFTFCVQKVRPRSPFPRCATLQLTARPVRSPGHDQGRAMRLWQGSSQGDEGGDQSPLREQGAMVFRLVELPAPSLHIPRASIVAQWIQDVHPCPRTSTDARELSPGDTRRGSLCLSL
jgi:hypothetical protein